MDLTALEHVMHALAHIADDHGTSVRSVDLNPVAVTAGGELVVFHAAVELFADG